MSLPETLTLFVDPGEDTGWCVARGKLLLGAGTTKMWSFADDVYDALAFQADLQTYGSELIDPNAGWVLPGMEEHVTRKIGAIVCEDWRLYPWKLKSLGWDQCRTARLIGALTLCTRVFQLDWTLQPAAIKEEAVRCGAEEFFYRPLHENRHANDAIMHHSYHLAFGPDGSGVTPNDVSNLERDST